MEVSIGILFGIIAMFGFGFSNAISQVPSKEIGSRKTIFFRNIFVSILLLILLLFFLDETNFSIKYIFIAFVISLVGYIPLVTFYKALKTGKVGIISPIANSSVVFTVLFSIIFFGESLSFIQLFSIVFIIFGIILVSLNFNDIKISHLFKKASGVPYALITCFLWGLVFFLFKIPVNVLGPILTSFIIEFGIMIYSGMHLRLSKINFDIPNKKILTCVFLVAFFGAIGTLFFNLGIKTSNVSIVAALTFSSPLVSILYGKFVYKEKLSLQQYTAIIFIVIGIASISYF
jgi:transporter family protein